MPKPNPGFVGSWVAGSAAWTGVDALGGAAPDDTQPACPAGGNLIEERTTLLRSLPAFTSFRPPCERRRQQLLLSPSFPYHLHPPPPLDEAYISACLHVSVGLLRRDSCIHSRKYAINLGMTCVSSQRSGVKPDQAGVKPTPPSHFRSLGSLCPRAAAVGPKHVGAAPPRRHLGDPHPPPSDASASAPSAARPF